MKKNSLKKVKNKIEKIWKQSKKEISIVALILVFLTSLVEACAANMLEKGKKIIESSGNPLEYREASITSISTYDTVETIQQAVTFAHKNKSYGGETEPIDGFEKGCILNSFIDNIKENSVSISKCTLIVEKIQEIEEANPVILGYIENGSLKIVVLNNGNGILEESELEIFGDYYVDNQYKKLDPSKLVGILDTEKNKLKISLPKLQKGEMIEIATFAINEQFFYAYKNMYQSWINLRANIKENNSGKEINDIFIGCLDYYDTGGAYIFRGQGDTDVVVKRAVILDVDSRHEEINIRTEYNIEGNSSKNIQLIILPTRSCILTFHASFASAGENEISTDTFEERINVPLYKDEDDLYSTVIECIMKNHITHYYYMSDSKIQKQIEYDPTNLVEELID